MKLALPLPSETQRRFFTEDHRYVAFGGARGGGKSWAVRVKAALLCWQYPGIKVMIVRRTYGELRANHIVPLCALLRCGADRELRLADYNETKKEISFPNGSVILFRYCAHERDADRFQGTEVDVLFVDEATQQTEEQVDRLRACVRGVNAFPKRNTAARVGAPQPPSTLPIAQLRDIPRAKDERKSPSEIDPRVFGLDDGTDGDPNLRIRFSTLGTIGALFRVGDAVTISGAAAAELNGTKIIRALGGGEDEQDWILLDGLPEASGGTEEALRIERLVPTPDFVCECRNRLWGCRYGVGEDGKTVNEILCSALGDFRNWQQFQGLSTDSWRASVGSDGPWTGAVNYLGSPIFFKENRIHRVSVSATGAHSVTETVCRGVQRGSAKSLVVVNETLFYKSPGEVCAWQGGFPSGVSSPLGAAVYHGAVGGEIGGKYYTQTVGGVTYYELTPGQTLGLYTSSGWQFWINGVRRGWFSSQDSMLHVSNIVAEEKLRAGPDWEISASGGFGLRYIGGCRGHEKALRLGRTEPALVRHLRRRGLRRVLRAGDGDGHDLSVPRLRRGGLPLFGPILQERPLLVPHAAAGRSDLPVRRRRDQPYRHRHGRRGRARNDRRGQQLRHGGAARLCPAGAEHRRLRSSELGAGGGRRRGKRRAPRRVPDGRAGENSVLCALGVQREDQPPAAGQQRAAGEESADAAARAGLRLRRGRRRVRAQDRLGAAGLSARAHARRGRRVRRAELQRPLEFVIKEKKEMNAPDKATEIRALVTLVIGFFTALWGWLGWAIVLFVASMAADYVTGTWAARARGEWSSAAARQGLWHKLGEIAALLVAALCDIAVQVLLHSAAAPLLGETELPHCLTLIVAIWYTFTELGSVIENAGLLGAPIPSWLKKGIAMLRDRTAGEREE
ncbi:MAG: phage holin family protein [Oscillospiraceae bacterium]|nr:phage holin family protein [Oscillospiraceae bacterium]